jgi:seryl-tRNA synthetase
MNYTKVTDKPSAIDKIDNYFLSFISHLHPERFESPTLISDNLLRNMGYFDSFPHILNAVTVFKPTCSVDPADIPAALCPCSTDMYLLPAACLHIYPTFKDQAIKATKIITARPRVFRYEGERLNNSTRLWEFQVREVVILGAPEEVLSILDEIFRKAHLLAQRMTLESTVVDATDHFYDSKKNAILKKLQRTHRYKREITIPLDGEPVALASANFHGTHFSKAWNFDADGKVVSGCIGFGLERWQAAHDVYGLND